MVDREHVSAFDVEVRVHEKAERQKKWRMWAKDSEQMAGHMVEGEQTCPLVLSSYSERI
jgi:hypothetical protein